MIGLKAFESKLNKKGHDAYYGYSAWDGDCAGFHVGFQDSPPYGAKFAEILLWFASGDVPANILGIVSTIAPVARTNYGYMSLLPANYDPVSESPIKHGLFGVSVQVGTNELRRWYKNIHLARRLHEVDGALQ